MTVSKIKMIAGALALTVGLSAAMPTLARADDNDSREAHHSWNADHDRNRDRDHDRNWQRGYNDPDYYNRPNYAYGRGYVPPNGEGMINRRNPNFYWACDSEGHHCHWARR